MNNLTIDTVCFISLCFTVPLNFYLAIGKWGIISHKASIISIAAGFLGTAAIASIADRIFHIVT
jgi:hypothetical protein